MIYSWEVGGGICDDLLLGGRGRGHVMTYSWEVGGGDM